jgi:CubicO group peptidase (beta-lactamase class C family)
VLWWLLLLAGPAAVAQLRLRPAEAAPQRYLAAVAAQYHLPGLQLARTDSSGRTTLLHTGRLAADEPAPVTEHSVFQAASLSKPVFAYLILRLVDRGVLGLDVPLSEYHVPHRRAANQLVAARITARMILRHTSGLAHWAEYGDSRITRWNQNVLQLKYPPDSLWHYSGEGYAYLQQVVEYVAGKPLQELAQQEVFDPLNMPDSSFGWDERFAGRLCSGHDSTGAPTLRRKFREPSAAFSLVSTAADYSRFVQALARGTGLLPATHQLLLTASGPAVRCGQRGTAAEEHISWALGVGLQQGRRGRALWHWGDNVDFKNFFLVFPDTGEALVYFSNGENGLRGARQLLPLFLGPDEDYWALDWLQER